MNRLALFLLVTLTVPARAAVPVELGTPDGTLRFLLRGLAENRPEVVWQILPARHQALVENEIKQTLGTLDEEIHRKSFGVFKELVDLLKTKRKFLEQVAGGDGMDDFDSMVNTLDVLAKSRLGNPQWARRPDVEALLREDGAKLMTNPAFIKLIDKSLANVAPAIEKLGGNGRPKVKSFKELQELLKAAVVTVKESTPQTATVKLAMGKGKDAHVEEIKMVKEGQRWLPESAADTFKAALAKKRKGNETRLLGMPLKADGMNARQKTMVIKLLDSLDMALDELDNTDTQAEFQQKLMATIIGLMPQIQKLQEEFGDPEAEANRIPGLGAPLGQPQPLPGLKKMPAGPVGLQMTWTTGQGNRNRIDQIYLGKPAATLKKVFGNPNQIKNGAWIYRGLKIRNLATGKRMTTTVFEMKDGKVSKILIQP